MSGLQTLEHPGPAPLAPVQLQRPFQFNCALTALHPETERANGSESERQAARRISLVRKDARLRAIQDHRHLRGRSTPRARATPTRRPQPRATLRPRCPVGTCGAASLRWGEVTALRRCDLDVDSGAVRVQRRTVVLSFLLTQSPAGLSRQWMQSWRVRGSRPGNDLLARRGAVRGSP